MGCCYSLFCKDDPLSQNCEPDENSPLLSTEIRSSAHLGINGDRPELGPLPSLPKKTDEQSALNRILQETATNVIDVAALDSQNIQQHECAEKTRTYSNKVQQICADKRNKLTNSLRKSILEDIPNSDLVLGSDSIDPDDKILIKTATDRAVAAITEIKVEHKEDLVVPFRITC